ncbi:ABC transporter permease [Rhizobium leguminosarum]|uniref:ABC transporter permease n=1 Tax=Rhizobium leguminosarum TaxID=384 RepID=UPI001C902B6D|nr:ABC transporter permease [Rhizobium leguminosarum]MBY2915362.1 ABC transporter permease [Rhizobium leguminosarum]MBY2970900.1 ABC transporter permease [Rhizobium leguminosarum]MBY2977967.1 ABC transporter permease [Rhizobium leguminosarum]MBY3006517.1 ABC transporter permease [Rhizobium leguminosarum]
MRRGNLITSRILQLIPTLALAIVVLFILVRTLPGGPAAAALGDRATDAAAARLNAAYGTDQSLLQQFGVFVSNLAHGDVGVSFALKVPVLQLIAERLPVTLMLSLMGAVLAVLIAGPLALLAALRKNRLADILLRGFFQVGLSLPTFYIGIIMLTFVAAGLRLFPVGGFGVGLVDNLYHLFLPALALSYNFAAVLFRNLRSSIIQVISSDYVSFATARGLPRSVVLFHHVVRNALISTVTLFGLNIGTLLGGAVVTETVFAIPGVGRLMIDSIFARDYPVVQGMMLVLTLVVSLVFLITDIVQSMLDPRIEN